MPDTLEPHPVPVPVPFRGTTLFVVEIDGGPYTALRPIIEGMGLLWHRQCEQIKADKKRFGIRRILMRMPSDEQPEQHYCIPLRKLFGWLMSIDPDRANPELQSLIDDYQAECDEVLWEHWMQQFETVFCDMQVRDVQENYVLAAEGFDGLSALFSAIGRCKIDSDAQSLARLGKCSAEDWTHLYRRHAEYVVHALRLP
jgi:hypothetical protein